MIYYQWISLPPVFIVFSVLIGEIEEVKSQMSKITKNGPIIINFGANFTTLTKSSDKQRANAPAWQGSSYDSHHVTNL